MVGKPRGIVDPRTGATKFKLSRLAPSAELAPFVEHYWIVTWDLREPYLSQTLPHPSVHVVVEPRRAYVQGILTGGFARRLTGRGRVFGIKFRPAMFQPVLTNRTLPFRDAFG